VWRRGGRGSAVSAAGERVRSRAGSKWVKFKRWTPVCDFSDSVIEQNQRCIEKQNATC